MIYTKYIAAQIRSHNSISLEGEALQRVFNIVVIESKIAAYQAAKKRMEGREEYHRYNMPIRNLQQHLLDLTQGFEPHELLPALRDGLLKYQPLKEVRFKPWPDHDKFAAKGKE